MALFTKLLSFFTPGRKIGIKAFKYWIDSTFRDRVIPVAGSVVYCDLYYAVEHSGICIDQNRIVNIEVSDVVESTVCETHPRDFVDKSKMHKMIYVSSDKNGSVGHSLVAVEAANKIGDINFYGLVFANCHAFSSKCVYKSPHEYSHKFTFPEMEETWEPTIRMLKKAARQKLNATKWLLWDCSETDHGADQQAPVLKETQDILETSPLNEKNIELIVHELIETREYIHELGDENIPEQAMGFLGEYKSLLGEIIHTYEDAKAFLRCQSGCDYTFRQLKELGEDYSGLARQMTENKKIQTLIQKLGKDYICKEKKKTNLVSERMQNEVHGLHFSSDILRLLPSEFNFLENEDCENYFYVRMLEQNLLTYQLKGVTPGIKQNELFGSERGPVIACIDTSGSMSGLPIKKAKAMLLRCAQILRKENRCLYIILFGSAGQLREFKCEDEIQSIELLYFLKGGFGGGTDFETPLARSVEIIKGVKNYKKADILMIGDGECSLSASFVDTLNKQKERYNFSIYSVFCDTHVKEDGFSDEAISI